MTHLFCRRSFVAASWRLHLPLLIRVLLSCVLGAPAMGHAQSPPGQAGTSPTRHSFAPQYVEMLDPIVLAVGLQPLRKAPLPSNTREVRLWVGGGIGWPQDLYRLVSKNGQVTGQWYRYWYSPAPDSTDPDQMPFGTIVRHAIAGQCSSIRTLGDAEVCHTRLTHEADWSAILHRIEQAGVENLPDETDLPRDGLVVMDGWMLTVEVRVGDNYRTYNYSNPDAHHQPEAQRAVAIAEALRPLGRLLPPSTNTKTFRGLFVSGPQRSEFVRCGSQESWGFQGNLGTASAWSNAPPSDTLTHPVRRLYVEAQGMLAYHGLARSWGSPYPEILYVDTVLVSRAWRPDECR